MRTENGELKKDNGGANLLPRTGRAPTPGTATQSKTRTGRAPTPGPATQSRHLLALAAAALIILHSPFSILNSPAASLSIASTNDYVYVAIPTNGTVDVRGLGAGPEGLYTMPRREDWMFFAEAIAERRAVSASLFYDAETVGTNTWYALPVSDYSAMPSSGQKYYFWPAYRSVYWTNGVSKLTVPTGYITSPAWANWIDNTGLDGGYFKGEYCRMMFSGRSYPVSLSVARMSHPDDYLANDWFFGPDLPIFGMVTNIYADIIANSHPLFCQAARTGGGSYTVTNRNTYDPQNVISSYDFSTSQWLYYPRQDTTVSDTFTYAYDKDRCYFFERRSLTKRSLSAIRNNVIVAQAREEHSDYYSSDRDLVGRITLPRYTQGTTLNGIHRAFAVVDFDRSTFSGTNTFASVRKTLIINTELVPDGYTSEGYPVYRERYDSVTPRAYHEYALLLLNQRLASKGELSQLIDYPEYPAASSAQGSYSAYTSVYDQIKTSVTYYIGSADVTFHARVLGN